MGRCLVGEKQSLCFIGQTHSVQGDVIRDSVSPAKNCNFNSFKRVGNELDSLNYVHS